MKKYNISNPFIRHSKRTDALEEAYEIFIDTFIEYAEKNNLSESEISQFKDEIFKTYLTQKSTYLLEDKLGNISDYINTAFRHSLENEDSIDTKIYYNRKSHLITTIE